VASVSITASGASDGLSGISGYQFRTSTDAGTTWSAVQSGATTTVSAEGETLVQLRSLDAAGNASSWMPAADGPANTVMTDRTAPTAPVVTGGSLSWTNAASVTVTGSGSTD